MQNFLLLFLLRPLLAACLDVYAFESQPVNWPLHVKLLIFVCFSCTLILSFRQWSIQILKKEKVPWWVSRNLYWCYALSCIQCKSDNFTPHPSLTSSSIHFSTTKNFWAIFYTHILCWNLCQTTMVHFTYLRFWQNYGIFCAITQIFLHFAWRPTILTLSQSMTGH